MTHTHTNWINLYDTVLLSLPILEKFFPQVVSYKSVTIVGEGEREEGEREGERPTHLAFGTKVPIPEHILASRKSCPLQGKLLCQQRLAGGKILENWKPMGMA